MYPAPNSSMSCPQSRRRRRRGSPGPRPSPSCPPSGLAATPRSKSRPQPLPPPRRPAPLARPSRSVFALVVGSRDSASSVFFRRPGARSEIAAGEQPRSLFRLPILAGITQSEMGRAGPPTSACCPDCAGGLPDAARDDRRRRPKLDGAPPIVVGGSGPSEGKSTTAINLGSVADPGRQPGDSDRGRCATPRHRQRRSGDHPAERRDQCPPLGGRRSMSR